MSKEWGAVDAWGMRHSFDLVARDTSGPWQLAIEVKYHDPLKTKSPNGEFQRMLGQCILARLKHNAVVGIYGYSGDVIEARSDDLAGRQLSGGSRYLGSHQAHLSEFSGLETPHCGKLHGAQQRSNVAV